jgi:hypothetical protein
MGGVSLYVSAGSATTSKEEKNNDSAQDGMACAKKADDT